MIEIMDLKHIEVEKASILTLLTLGLLFQPVYNSTFFPSYLSSSSHLYKVNENDQSKIYTQLQNGFEVLKKNMEQIQKDEDDRRPDDIVRHVKLGQFSEAERKLKQNFNGTYKYVVHEVYHNQIGNFDIVMRFGDSISDIWRKYKIYEALRKEMEMNDHNDDTWKLLQLRDSIKKGVLDRGADMVNAKSLYNFIWRLVRDDVPGIISYYILIDRPPIRLSDDAYFLAQVSIWEKVLYKLWHKLDPADICDRVRKYRPNIDVQIAFEFALNYHLNRVNELHSSHAITLALNIKSTMNDIDYLDVSADKRFTYERLKDGLPQSVKVLVFSPVVCIRNNMYDEYLYSGVTNYQYDEKRGRVFTWMSKSNINNEPIKFEWTVSFVDNHRITLSDHFNEYLFSEYDGSEIKPFDETRNFVFINISSTFYRDNNGTGFTQYQWDIEIDNNSMFLKNHRTNQYLMADCCIHYNNERREVFTHRGWRPSSARWSIEDCNKIDKKGKKKH